MKRHYIFTTPQSVDKFMADLEQSLDKTRIETVNQATWNARRYAGHITPRRLPSRGGGSYGRSHNMRIHHDPVGSMGLSTGEAYNNHQWAQGVEFGTSPHKQVAKGRAMRITNVIPGYYKGRNINTVPYGVKYEQKKPPLEVLKVDHPGSRAFHIYTDTFKRLVTHMKRILKKAFKDNW